MDLSHFLDEMRSATKSLVVASTTSIIFPLILLISKNVDPTTALLFESVAIIAGVVAILFVHQSIRMHVRHRQSFILTYDRNRIRFDNVAVIASLAAAAGFVVTYTVRIPAGLESAQLEAMILMSFANGFACYAIAKKTVSEALFNSQQDIWNKLSESETVAWRAHLESLEDQPTERKLDKILQATYRLRRAMGFGTRFFLTNGECHMVALGPIPITSKFARSMIHDAWYHRGRLWYVGLFKVEGDTVFLGETLFSCSSQAHRSPFHTAFESNYDHERHGQFETVLWVRRPVGADEWKKILESIRGAPKMPVSDRYTRGGPFHFIETDGPILDRQTRSKLESAGAKITCYSTDGSLIYESK